MFRLWKSKQAEADREKLARLEQAETEVRDLRERADRAIGILAARQGRNHWSESIDMMIRGVR